MQKMITNKEVDNSSKSCILQRFLLFYKHFLQQLTIHLSLGRKHDKIYNSYASLKNKCETDDIDRATEAILIVFAVYNI